MTRLFDLNPRTNLNLLPESIFFWLQYKSSLTLKLADLGGKPRLEIIHEGLHRTDWWDQYALELKPNERVFHREILTWDDQKPCWYARTIIPEQTLSRNFSFFHQLKEKSLGELIFNNPRIRRTQFINYAIDHQFIEYYWFPKIAEEDYYGVRLSEFTYTPAPHLPAWPFYLCEILLPDLLRYP